VLTIEKREPSLSLSLRSPRELEKKPELQTKITFFSGEGVRRRYYGGARKGSERDSSRFIFGWVTIKKPSPYTFIDKKRKELIVEEDFRKRIPRQYHPKKTTASSSSLRGKGKREKTTRSEGP